MGLSVRTTKLLRIATIAIVAVLVGVFASRIEWHELTAALRDADPAPLVLSSALYFVCLFGKSLVWRIMLEPRNVVPIRRMYRYTIAAQAASALTPARAGELLRVWVLKKRDGVPAAEATAVAIAEKLLLVITLLIVVAPVPWLLPRLPDWVANAMLTSAGIGAGMLVVLFFAVGRVDAREPRSWFARMIAGMHVVRDPKRMALAVITLLFTWSADLIAVMLVLHAVGIDLPIAGGMFILFTFNLAIALPSTPGQIGALQVGALVATGLLRIPEEQALAFALLYQAMQLVPLVIVGLILELDLVRGRIPAEPQPAA
ncbi:MAG TPA: lysylphosphatidylglycerol synthase transmembrane domain-containing protein [Kofleriaceae bacterium]